MAEVAAPHTKMRAQVPAARWLECVHCGLCLPACPTYLELGTEADSPRGRIHLMREWAEGRVPLTGEVVRHLDLCLGCLGCEAACPSGVRYREMIEGARVAVEQSYQRRWREALLRRLVVDLFPYPDRLAILLWPVRLADWMGLGPVVRKLPWVELVPLPLPRKKAAAALVPARGARRYRVALFRGCVARVLFPQVEAALVRILADHGCEVVVPGEQGCCGALAAHQGDRDRAVTSIRAVLRVFTEPVDALLVTAAGCGAFLRSYGHWTEGTELQERAKLLALRVRDATEFLSSLKLLPPARPLGRKVAYHHACHLAHAQGIRDEPVRLLQLAGAELVRLEEADLCCGSAGSYNILQPQLAQRLGERKARNILASGAEVVAVGNPGCSMQIQAALRRLGADIAVLHPVEVLDVAYRESTA